MRTEILSMNCGKIFAPKEGINGTLLLSQKHFGSIVLPEGFSFEITIIDSDGNKVKDENGEILRFITVEKYFEEYFKTH